MNIQTFDIVPVPAPRQCRSDAWRPRKCVLEYRAFRDEVAFEEIVLTAESKVTFHIPMPASWSDRKKAANVGRPHRQKPDIDNLFKALCDACFRDSDDSHIWQINAKKLWAYTGYIEVAE